jgi:hypothetical protein
MERRSAWDGHSSPNNCELSVESGHGHFRPVLSRRAPRLGGGALDHEARDCSVNRGYGGQSAAQGDSVGGCEEPVYFDLRRLGKTVRSPLDCCITQVAMDNQTLLLHRDRDFEVIAEIRPLQQRFVRWDE